MGVDEWIRCDDQASARLVRKREDGGFDLGLVVDRLCCQLDSERSRGLSKLMQENGVIGRGLWIEHEHHPPDARGDLLKHLQPFPDQGKFDECETGDVSARTPQAGDEALSERIIDHRKDDRDSAGRLFQCRKDWRTAGDNEVRGRIHEFRRVSLHLGEITGGKPMLDLNIAVLHPSERLKSLPKRRDAGLYFWIGLGE